MCTIWKLKKNLLTRCITCTCTRRRYCYLQCQTSTVKLGLGRSEYVFTRSWKISLRVHFEKKILFEANEPYLTNPTRTQHKVKPGSHRQDMAQDTARTCHDQEFRSENSFNSWSWQRPGQCPSKIVGVLGAPTTKGWSGQILGHVQVFATISPESQDKFIIADTSGTCPGRFRDMA